jgi:serine/threonine protein phosphatase 1
MRKVIGWLSRNKTSQAAPLRRRRIDLGERPAPYPIYAIGDVHGCLDQLKQAEARIAADIAATGRSGLVVLLGDYIDRGPSSAQVIEHLVEPSELGLKRLPLCGNHDDLFLRFIANPEKHADWIGLGGEQTLKSYGIDIHDATFRQRSRAGTLAGMLADAVPDSHRQFLESLPVSLKVGDLFLVHAGIRPGIATEDQTDEDMLWIREPFLTQGPKLAHTIVIHGHTPHTEPNPGPQRIGIDTGAFYSGVLTVLRIDGSQIAFI